MTRAKFKLYAVKNPDGSMSVSGQAVSSDDPNHENKAFNDATPAGNFSMHIAAGKEAQSNFDCEQPKEYYVDITAAE